MIKAIRLWVNEYPRRFALLAILMAVLAGYSLFNGPLGKEPDGELPVAEEPDIGESAPPLVFTATPPEEPPTFEAVEVEPTEEVFVEPIADNVVTMRITLANCEAPGECKIPMWRTHEREVITGFVPQDAEVSVFGCYYPPVRGDVADTTIESGEPYVIEFQAYALEGLWCETLYEAEEAGPVKGMVQYWFLSSLP